LICNTGRILGLIVIIYLVPSPELQAIDANTKEIIDLVAAADDAAFRIDSGNAQATITRTVDGPDGSATINGRELHYPPTETAKMKMWFSDGLLRNDVIPQKEEDLKENIRFFARPVKHIFMDDDKQISYQDFKSKSAYVGITKERRVGERGDRTFGGAAINPRLLSSPPLVSGDSLGTLLRGWASNESLKLTVESIESSDSDENHLKIRVYASNTDSEVFVVVDPLLDYRLVHFEVRNRDRLLKKAEYAYQKKSVYGNEEWVIARYRFTSTFGETLQNHRTVNVELSELNITEVDPNVFTLDGLGVLPGTVVRDFRVHPNMTYRFKESLSEDYLNQILDETVLGSNFPSIEANPDGTTNVEETPERTSTSSSSSESAGQTETARSTFDGMSRNWTLRLIGITGLVVGLVGIGISVLYKQRTGPQGKE